MWGKNMVIRTDNTITQPHGSVLAVGLNVPSENRYSGSMTWTGKWKLSATILPVLTLSSKENHLVLLHQPQLLRQDRE